jgi:hypothetical protein
MFKKCLFEAQYTSTPQYVANIRFLIKIRYRLRGKFERYIYTETIFYIHVVDRDHFGFFIMYHYKHKKHGRKPRRIYGLHPGPWMRTSGHMHASLYDIQICIKFLCATVTYA